MNPLRKFKDNKKVINITIIKCTAYKSILIFLYMSIELVGSYQLPGLKFTSIYYLSFYIVIYKSITYLSIIDNLLSFYICLYHLFIYYLHQLSSIYLPTYHLYTIYLLIVFIYLPLLLSVVGYLYTMWKYIALLGVIKSWMARSKAGSIGGISRERKEKEEESRHRREIWRDTGEAGWVVCDRM